MRIEHTFVICAYKQSPYLEQCMISVRNQTAESKVILTTSTPCEYIERLCRKYQIPYLVNNGAKGIAGDWNFAYSMSNTPVVTLAHQDDIYFRTYVERAVEAVRRARKPLIFFSDYYEIRDGKMIKSSALLKIKRAMLFPLKFQTMQSSIRVRRWILSIGSPICCPSVSMYKRNMPETVFLEHFRSNCDWEAWENISKMKGQFLYCGEPLMAHRIHKESETTAAILDGKRIEEDFEMFKKFWPKWFARILAGLYKKSEELN